MKFVKSVSIFFVYPMLTASIGFLMGMLADDYFYPLSDNRVKAQNITKVTEVEEVVTKEQTINVGTVYEIIEYEMNTDTYNSIQSAIPSKYIGLTRDELEEDIRLYAMYPPLSEKTRGLVDMQVIVFSTERVTVRKDYCKKEKKQNFYVAAFNNKLVILLEDKQTVYMETDIRLDTLPDKVQEQIIEMLYVEGEDNLFDLLESYSS